MPDNCYNYFYFVRLGVPNLLLLLLINAQGWKRLVGVLHFLVGGLFEIG